MLATQLAFGAMLRPKYVGNATPTLELAENILYYNAGRGIAPLLPLGLILSSRIESRLLEAARILGYAQIELPHIVSTEILKNGAPMASGFRDVLVPLSGRMHMQHLMCTPEMQIAQMLRASQASHRALPLRCCYIATFFRQLRQPRPLLKGREFRIFGAMTFGRANEELAGTVVELKALTVRLLEDLGIPYEEVSRGPTHFELFYPMVNGIDHYIIGKVRRRGLSLAMSYEYEISNHAPKYRDEVNNSRRMRSITFGLGLQRLLFASVDAVRRSHGFLLPRALQAFTNAFILRDRLSDPRTVDGPNILIDDRLWLPIRRRRAFCEFLGIETISTW